ncbi:hypothetical protein OWR29_25455 [Actinoplanes sp. Pm04-4]|uniref:Uncharacterized protein n=1 Tax=Paractinoplanes pyxinae TaxID=2997416 RepID=A0ABT4B4D7_9ACTN|nr:hypothetical protein [Actinoplanes pyxinae]MCY1141359.1 hypothetical protein [Actinoplanes pyxinae]
MILAGLLGLAAIFLFAGGAGLFTSSQIDPHDEDPGDDTAAWRPHR